MKPVPLPSHVHYELLLQLLERQTLATTEHQSALREQVQQLMISLRKAFAQQKQLEDFCKHTQVPFEHRWSLNSITPPAENLSEDTQES